ncbi:VCBS repeat-containing protein [Luteolibacter ambystomatis]|uniref:VCBS repeat-containing protein n=1 Tax=Luteolibacter ambystomatis TaxID=2824561 RepID=A0A975PGU8_9BACT|nr:VCBS repeat-containing protein [Luteolibacter ambystomatis]QUE53093.1 VCBS repeat-containing protein [Luteolibacter ambystomatis]
MLRPILLSSLASISTLTAVHASPPRWEVPVSDSGYSTWGFTQFRGRMGAAGMFTLDTGNGPEIHVSATLETNGTAPDAANLGQFWYVMGWDPETHQLETRHVTTPSAAEGGAVPPYAAGPYEHFTGFQAAQVAGDETPEVLTCSLHGTVTVYDARTRVIVRTYALHPQGPVACFRAVDLTGDGVPEFITSSTGLLTVHDVAGTLLWSTADVSGGTFVVGQVDDDAAPEIIMPSGQVVDTVTHQTTAVVQPGHWDLVAVVDLNGDGIDELVGPVHGTTALEALDARHPSSPLWSQNMPGGTMTKLLVENIDDDPARELVVTSSTGPGLSVYRVDATGCEVKWRYPLTTGADISGLAVVPTDAGDGSRALLWSSLHPTAESGTSKSFMCVRTDTLEEIGTGSAGNFQLDGPFLPPVIGDVTGDGFADIVTASTLGKAGKQGGSIVVIDGLTRHPIAVSEQIWTRIEDVKLRDVDGDGRLEIIVTSSDTEVISAIRVYKFNASDKSFTFVYGSESPVDGNLYTRTEMADVDGDGVEEFISVNRSLEGDFPVDPHYPKPSGQPEGCYLTITKAPGKLKWRSAKLATAKSGFTCLAVADVDGDGNLEAVFGGGETGLFVVDLRTQVVELADPSVAARAVVADAAHRGFLVGTAAGKVARYTSSAPDTYVAGTMFTVSDQPVTGLVVDSPGGMWITSGGRFQYWADSSSPAWSAETRLSHVDGPPALVWNGRSLEAYLGYGYGISAFEVDADATDIRPHVAISLAGALAEGGAEGAVLKVELDFPTAEPLAVPFHLNGTAGYSDVFLAGVAAPVTGPRSLVIPAGQLSAYATVLAQEDALGEGTETFGVMLEGSDIYGVVPPGKASLPIADNDPVVTISPLLPTVLETWARDAAPAGWVLTRTGDLTKPQKVMVEIGGTATSGKDYRKLATLHTIPARKSSLTIPFNPLGDAIVELPETVTMTVLPGVGFGVPPAQGIGTIQLLDVSSFVSLDAPRTVPSGVEVTFRRYSGVIKPLTVAFIETKVTNGRPVQSRRRVTFREDRDTVVYSVRAGTKPFSGGITLVPDASYTSGGTTSVVFEVGR